MAEKDARNGSSNIPKAANVSIVGHSAVKYVNINIKG